MTCTGTSGGEITDLLCDQQFVDIQTFGIEFADLFGLEEFAAPVEQEIIVDPFQIPFIFNAEKAEERFVHRGPDKIFVVSLQQVIAGKGGIFFKVNILHPQEFADAVEDVLGAHIKNREAQLPGLDKKDRLADHSSRITGADRKAIIKNISAEIEHFVLPVENIANAFGKTTPKELEIFEVIDQAPFVTGIEFHAQLKSNIIQLLSAMT